MLALLEEAVAVARDPGVVDPVRVADLVLSPIGGSDTVGLRRLRRLLRQEELAGGGGRSSDELLSELVRDPLWAGRLGGTARPAARIAAALAAGVGRHAWGRMVDGRPASPPVGPLGDLAGRGCRRRVAEAGTRRRPGGARADRDLDAVLALFDAAGSFVDRLPTAGPDVRRARPRPGRAR